MRMPDPDQATIARRREIADELSKIVPGEGVIFEERERQVYESDGLTAYRQLPLLVVLPSTTEEVSAVLRYCHENDVKIVPRGAGTSLSGGALPLADGITLGLGKFKGVLEIDYDNRCAVVQPGVTNLGVTNAVSDAGFYYAPDPSSQIACTIGGNVAENSGGVHCLKYGMTTNNILGIEMVLMDGEIVRLGGKHLDSEGYDLMGVMTGSEGLLGIVTEVTVRILPKPATARALLVGFPSNESAGDCVARVIGAGIIPGGMEMMDKPAIHAAEAFVHAGYPLDVEALLIVELDGPKAEVDELIARVRDIADACGAVSLRVSETPEERESFWAGRKAAFPAVGRISPDYYCMDGTIPRAKLPHVLHRMGELSEQYGLKVANVFHAGDGNLHPLILYDANKAGELDRAESFGADILKLCVEVGGVLTGRAWCGRRETRPDAGNVHRGRSQASAAREMRVRPEAAPQSGQGLPATTPLRRARPDAHPSGTDALPRSAALLSGTPMSTTSLKPTDPAMLRDMVAMLAADRKPVEVTSGGSKRAVGRPSNTEYRIDLSGMDRIELYEPDELILSAASGTPISLIEKALAVHRQQLAFEPMDLGPLLGGEPEAATLGGVIACNLSGPRRIKIGAARDHFLGLKGVSGRGEAFKAGGRVVKNVTGYDLCKLLAGSWGTLAIMHTLTIKVLPAPETTATLMLNRLDDGESVTALAAALKSAYEVSGVAHLPAGTGAVIEGIGPDAASFVRVEGFEASVAARVAALTDILAPFGEVSVLDEARSLDLWAAIRDVRPLIEPRDRPVWKVSTAPMSGPAFVAALPDALQARAFYDWGGGLVWLSVAEGSDDAGAAPIRAALAPFGGHATLIRADAPVRAAVEVFHPASAGVAALSRRVKEGFDPHGILNPGRMMAGV